MDKNLRREIILDNYQNPYNKKIVEDNSYIKINTNNESCIDDLDIFFKIENNIIKDVAFTGEACAISTSATSIMLRNLVGKTTNEVKEILINYINMINEKPYEEEKINELIVYNEIYLQPNRKNCALLPAKGVERLLKQIENDN